MALWKHTSTRNKTHGGLEVSLDQRLLWVELASKTSIANKDPAVKAVKIMLNRVCHVEPEW